MKLFKFQEESVEFLCSPRTPSKSVLLAHEPGLGKSACAIVACDKLMATQILVVCPAFLRENWKREFELWAEPGDIQIIATGTDIILCRRVTIVSYDLISKGFTPENPNQILRQLLKMKFDVGIFDESHYLKNYDSLRTRVVFLKNHLASRCEYKFFLTGTPILNRPVELYPLLKACIPKVIEPYGTYRKFADRFCGGFFNGYEFWDRGATHIEDLQERLEWSGLMLRREKKDVLPELPEKFYQIVRLDADAKMKKAVEDQKNSLDEIKMKANRMEAMDDAAARHRLALTKIPAAADFIRNLLEQVEKVVVWCHHHDVIDGLQSGLCDFKPIILDGRVSMGIRQARVDSFQNTPACRLFIGQMQAAGVGLTLTAADNCVFVEPSFVPGEIEQCVDRLNRIGARSTTICQFLVVADSLEESIMATMIKKISVINRLVKCKS